VEEEKLVWRRKEEVKGTIDGQKKKRKKTYNAEDTAIF